MNAKKPAPEVPDCKEQLIAIRDTMILLSGKWKIQIIGWLLYGKVRFMDLLRGIDGIAAKMLSKELQELEQNELVVRTVMPTKPITVASGRARNCRNDRRIALTTRFGTDAMVFIDDCHHEAMRIGAR